MPEQNYILFSNEWKKEMSKLPKKAIIDIAANIGKDNEQLKSLANLRLQCRNYLMGIKPEDLTIEDCLEQLGYGRNGL
jgi:hypothetical protein